MQNSFVIQFASRSHKGKVRKNNQDHLGVEPELNLAVIADGIGGKHFGEIASEIGVAACTDYIKNADVEVLSSKPLAEMSNAIKYANESIITIQQNEPKYKNMGTTLACFWIDQQQVHYSWVGDSRIYLLNPLNKKISLLTKDHTLDKSKIDPLLSPDLYQRASSILTQYVGSILLLKPDTKTSILSSGDVLLGCTDGLSDLVKDELILEYSEKFIDDLEGLADKLLDRALDCGGYDNVSFVLAKVI